MTSFGCGRRRLMAPADAGRRPRLAIGVLLVVLAVALLPSPGAGLIVTSPHAEPRTYNHMTADFGPSRFNVTGQMAVALDTEGLVTLCNPSAQRHDGQVVLVRRGTCSFAKKALNALDSGAVAIVVGNNEDSDPPLIKMGRSSGDNSSAVTIPAIFVSFRTYNTLFPALQDPTAQIQATVNRVGEVTMILDTLGWVTFFLPFLAITVTLMMLYHCRRRLIRNRRRVVRVNAAAQLPIVEWQPHPDQQATQAEENVRSAPSDVVIQLGGGEEAKAPGADSLLGEGQVDSSTERLLNAEDPRLSTNRLASPPVAASAGGSRRGRGRDHHNRVLNDTCVICLTEFEAGEQVKKLPCRHGFHAVCIDPWLNERSDECPICKASVTAALEAQQSCWRTCGGIC